MTFGESELVIPHDCYVEAPSNRLQLVEYVSVHIIFNVLLMMSCDCFLGDRSPC